jgi:hypothetical protein
MEQVDATRRAVLLLLRKFHGYISALFVVCFISSQVWTRNGVPERRRNPAELFEGCTMRGGGRKFKPEYKREKQPLSLRSSQVPL